jgi:spore coat polysaccharide biosynthesis protein SpsF
LKRIAVILQARMGSTRLPKKVLKDIVGKPMLWHIINRIKKAKSISQIVIATTTKEKDKPIVKLALENGVNVFLGNEDDVLDRYYKAALTFKADIIVRITGDCPLIDPEVIDSAVNYYCSNSFDYVSTARSLNKQEHKHSLRVYPDGLDVEVFSFAALQKAWKHARLTSEREHVTPYIWKRHDAFRIGIIECDQNLSEMRWTVDNPKDLVFIRAIYEKLYNEKSIFKMKDVLSLLKAYPELAEINKGFTRNFGYLRSLEKDQRIDYFVE